MVYLKTSEEWQQQSSLLLQARPSTTRITTRYNIPNLDAPKYSQTKKRKRETEGGAGEDKETAAAASRVPRGTLTLKTYDPDSGVVLKFTTDRAAEVGRLINGLGRLGRHMAALPEKSEDVTMEEAPSAEQSVPASQALTPAGESKPSAGTGGGGKKKKKGKK